MANRRRLLVTSALPYGNGAIHIGHLVEYIQTDIWVRYQRLRGHDVLYVCGDDAHGTPIMLKAKSLGMDPKTFIAQTNAQHQADFAQFSISFDNYYTTDSPINQDLVRLIYDGCKTSGLITTREIEQLFDPVENIFLPDRFIKGTCPRCKSPEQYGDSCDVCGATYDPTDLIDPKSAVSGATPILKKSEHVFFTLEPMRPRLLKLYEGGMVDPSIKNKLMEWFGGALKDWDISRDAPFFGFAIPDHDGKFFYNWFDAPIGYIASLGNKLEFNAKETLDWWNQEDVEVYHFIGKDITYFHALFWPAQLMGAGLRPPTKLAIHGFLTVNGQKMSKSKGTFVQASTYAKHLDPQWLRYYYASKLVPQPEDLDLSFDDFVARVNAELVGKLANLISRAAPILTRQLEGKLGVVAMDALSVINELRSAETAMADDYENRNFAAVTRRICALADKVNKYVEDQAPWALIKKDPEEARGVLTAALEAGRILTIYLKPILPEFAAKVEQTLALSPLEWKHIQDSMEARTIRPFQHLAGRVEQKNVEAMVEESKSPEKPEARSQKPEGGAAATTAAQPVAAAPAGTTPAPNAADVGEPLAPTINFDQFMGVDLRVARVISAEPVEKSDKLMRIRLDVGPLGERTILAGIKKAYTPDRLNGRLIIFCANLAPRTMGKFGTSEGMILASGPGGPEVFVLSPDQGAVPGQRVH